jgi:hypothetical protein
MSLADCLSEMKMPNALKKEVVNRSRVLKAQGVPNYEERAVEEMLSEYKNSADDLRLMLTNKGYNVSVIGFGKDRKIKKTPKPAADQTSKNPTKKEAAALREKMFDLYYQADRIIKSYGGYDKVLSYTYSPFQVNVVAVKKDGDNWIEDGQPRNHSTYPSMKLVEAVWAQEGQTAQSIPDQETATVPEAAPAAGPQKPDETASRQYDVGQGAPKLDEKYIDKLGDSGVYFEANQSMRDNLQSIPDEQFDSLENDMRDAAERYVYSMKKAVSDILQTNGYAIYSESSSRQSASKYWSVNKAGLDDSDADFEPITVRFSDHDDRSGGNDVLLYWGEKPEAAAKEIIAFLEKRLKLDQETVTQPQATETAELKITEQPEQAGAEQDNQETNPADQNVVIYEK